MNKKLILTIVGARPQFIKAALLSKTLQKQQNIKELILHTGQHYDNNMSKVFFKELDIPSPQINLNIKEQLQGKQTAKMLEGIEKYLIKLNPSLVIVYGDTNSTLAGALAASKLNIPLAHIEAGLRSFNKKMPEEINRILTDHVSDLLFAPTSNAVKLLKQEGINNNKIYLVGDIMFDVALYYKNKAKLQSNILNTLKIKPKNYILTTIHRAENTDNPNILKNIFNVLLTLSQTINIIIPLHPRTKNKLKTLKIDIKKSPYLNIIEPVGYLDMVQLETHASMIITDSGGVQKEAYFYKVPCITLREQTEWIELVNIGANTLISPSQSIEYIVDKILNILSTMYNDKQKSKNIFNKKLYGTGDTAQKIVNILINKI